MDWGTTWGAQAAGLHIAYGLDRDPAALRTFVQNHPTAYVDGSTFYRIGEALDKARLIRSTYFRWVRDGRIGDARYRDRNGRRVLTPEEVRFLIEEANQLVEVPPSKL